MEMRRICYLFLGILLIFQLSACKTIEPVYYTDSNVPTFTCVTGIEASKRTYFPSAKSYIYVYLCSDSEKSASKYMDYLKKDHGFTILESNDNYDNMITLVKDNSGVIVTVASETEVDVIPYKRAS